MVDVGKPSQEELELYLMLLSGKKLRRRFKIVEGPFPDPTRQFSELQLAVVEPVNKRIKERLTVKLRKSLEYKPGDVVEVWVSQNGNVAVRPSK